jgi:hypothetical protein
VSALTEAQVQRYGRQVLLREVGGRGQRRLLEAPFVVEGTGPAFDVAVAYLAASGSPVRLRRDAGGFLDGVALADFAPDAGLEGPPAGWLGPLEALPRADAAWHRVALGPGVVVGLSAHAPAPTDVAPAEADDEPVTQGALAALVAQRFVLGLETAMLVELGARGGRWARRR